ncbi:MAG: thioredoxin domain-containing protein, partial [Chloroflexota bacterium]|nr:thioredoxin domain-containing protein [Chloroflexota bacterium]
AAGFAAADPVEIAIAGAPGDASTRALVQSAFGVFLPHRVMAVGDPADSGTTRLSPLLTDRPLVGGRPAAYVCRRRVCLPAVTDAGELANVLAAGED